MAKIEEKLDTILGSGSELEGELKVKGGVRIDGSFKGSIEIQGMLVVGESGKLDGEIRAAEAVLAGTVKGKLFIEGRVEFQATARFEGELVCKTLIVHEGAVFDGTCQMSRREEKPKAVQEPLRSVTPEPVTSTKKP